MAAIDFNTYAADYARNRRVQPRLLQHLIAGLAVGEGDSVLEVGCGTANYLVAIAQETGATAFGIDPAANMLGQAVTEQHGAPLHLMIGSGEAIPFPDSSFDAVYSVDVIHHVGNRPLFASEAFRVLKPGGRFATATDSHEDIHARVPLASHFPETIPAELERYPAIEVQMLELRSAGFDEVRSESLTHAYALDDITPYRTRAYSALRVIPEEAVERGIARLEAELAEGPIPAVSRYTIIWAIRP